MSARNSADETQVRTVSLTEFRDQCSALLKQVHKRRQRICVTRYGRTIAEIHPPGLTEEQRAQRDARDLELINRYADELNADATDGLEYQTVVGFDKNKARVSKRKRTR